MAAKIDHLSSSLPPERRRYTSEGCTASAAFAGKVHFVVHASSAARSPRGETTGNLNAAKRASSDYSAVGPCKIERTPSSVSDSIPELVSELQQRSARIANLEAQVAAAKRPPNELVSLVKKVEATVRDNVRALRAELTDPADLREVFEILFPNGLTFAPARTPDGKRQIWEIEGDARFDRLDQARFRLSNDPGAEEDGTSSEMRRRNVARSERREPARPDEASRFRLNGDPNVQACIRNLAIRIHLKFQALRPVDTRKVVTSRSSSTGTD